MGSVKVIKDYRVGEEEVGGRKYIRLVLVTDDGEEAFLLEWGYFARSFATDILRQNSEISIRRQIIGR